MFRALLFVSGLILAGAAGCLSPSVKPRWRVPSSEPVVAPLRVNQVGYFPHGPKLAAVVSKETAPLSWRLLNETGATVAAGRTVYLGKDADSRETVHLIDFSEATARGDGYVLQVGTDKSPPFAISDDLYAKLRRHALEYFYLNRSGIPLEMPYAKDPGWARPAGHLSDRSVGCEWKTDCTYRLDVTGGWYDAGDYGKYVVNGGLSAWLLLSYYERTQNLGGDLRPLSDTTLSIPENRNDVPDILDEARWEVEWLLKMQVPEGERKAGMAHHKMHDINWSALGIPPETESRVSRILKPPSTAATLNLAAVGALAARLFQPFDPAFAHRCLEAAERAWQAALDHPRDIASERDHTGGGPYGDKRVDDDFYWAASELWITTKRAEYWNYLTQSPYYERISTDAADSFSAFNWANTDALGTISLALYPDEILPTGSRQQHRDALIRVADQLLGLTAQQGFRYPFQPGEYPWGSNSVVLNNGVVLALAHDFTHERRYLDGAIWTADYILGRNANGFSYVSGYGTRAMTSPHHRFWCPSVNDNLPPPPPGSVAGGPNSNLDDPAMDANRFGCAPAKCYMDNAQSYSTNEVAINWNAALAWIAAYLDDNRPATPSGEVPDNR